MSKNILIFCSLFVVGCTAWSTADEERLYIGGIPMDVSYLKVSDVEYEVRAWEWAFVRIMDPIKDY